MPGRVEGQSIFDVENKKVPSWESSVKTSEEAGEEMARPQVQGSWKSGQVFGGEAKLLRSGHGTNCLRSPGLGSEKGEQA